MKEYSAIQRVAVICAFMCWNCWLDAVVSEERAPITATVSPPAWKWTCESGKCKKVEFEEGNLKTALSLEACKMFCNATVGTLWPLPTGAVSLGSKLIRININKIKTVIFQTGKSDSLLRGAIERFNEKIKVIIPEDVVPAAVGKSLTVNLINNSPDITALKLSTDESYTLLTFASNEGNMNANVTADNFYGLRHGLETLLQLIIYDDIRNEIQMVKNAKIVDKPVHPYRGLMLDTARNYHSVQSIKRTIDAMAAVKLNTFHWHITDTHSFPFVSQSRPELSKYGAYSPTKVYTMNVIKDLVQYARVRGVRVLPEFDAPAHVGEGWQKLNMTVCFKAEPWTKFCVEPPCGQLNPAAPGLYDVLQDIYNDMFEAFQPDMFHMGGDEVNEACWNSSQHIRQFLKQNHWNATDTGFLKLWDYFQANAAQRVYKANQNEKLPIILWTSSITVNNVIDLYLNKEDYIIQVWSSSSDPDIQNLLKKGYRLIMSNVDALYLDCGFGAWVGQGNNWCSPYKGWQKVYDNSPAKLAGTYKDLMLGGEAALWSEQADTSALDSRFWPRAAALAERLWAEPESNWDAAEQRMLHIRERLVKMGVQADTLQPEWCFQNEGNCYS